MTNTTTSAPTRDLHLDPRVKAPAHTVHDAVADVAGWWSTHLDRSGNEFTVHFDQNWTRVRAEDGHWTITAQDTPALPVPDEWVGDTLTFEVEEVDDTTIILHFTHHGLLAQECADECRPAWQHYIASLVSLAETGEGQPWKPGLAATGRE
jgi:hypothetical protein